MRLLFKYAGKSHPIELNGTRAGWEAWVDGKRVPLAVKPGDELELHTNGQVHRVAWARQPRKLWLHFAGRTYELERVAGGQASAAAGGGESLLRAPMPGQVVKVQVQTGEPVKAGSVLVVLEAMKMEVRIQAPWDATVTRISVKQGQSVEKEQVLVELEPDHAR